MKIRRAGARPFKRPAADVGAPSRRLVPLARLALVMRFILLTQDGRASLSGYWAADVPVPADVMAAAFRSAFAFRVDIRTGRKEGPDGVTRGPSTELY